MSMLEWSMDGNCGMDYGMDFGMDYGIKRKAFFVPNSTV